MTLKNSPNINLLWSSLLIEELVRGGVEYFCLSSGSRSAPLVLAVASNQRAKAFVHFDERAMAFHALGYASATGKPVVVITTSGTAAANLLPAVIEASKKKLPLMILTADRPPELRLTGAHQTIDHQHGIFGHFARWSVDMPCPTQEIGASFVLTTVDQALNKAQTDVKGPVHLNCAFREPLGTQKTHRNFNDYLKPLKGWLASDRTLTRYRFPAHSIDPRALDDVVGAVGRARSGVIAVGKLSSEQDRKAVLKLAEALNWPVFPDAVSGLRLSARHSNVIACFDQLLLSGKFRNTFKADCVIQFGGRMTSRRFYQFLEGSAPRDYVMVLNHSLRHDPLHNVTLRVHSKPAVLAAELLKRKIKPSPVKRLREMVRLNKSVDAGIEAYFNESQSLNEIRAARLISELVPAGTNLFLGNSMPVRDLEMFGVSDRQQVFVTGNRGASGIDGNIASAAGYAAGSGRMTTLVAGDLAFLYDLNALSMLRDLPVPVIIVVMNNQGGGIFSFLPVADNNPHFEKFWGTPHPYDFSHAAAQFGLDYACPSTTEEFCNVYSTAVKNGKSMIIEVRSNREDNVREHEILQERIKRILK